VLRELGVPRLERVRREHERSGDLAEDMALVAPAEPA
jgi:hypothetical protein